MSAEHRGIFHPGLFLRRYILKSQAQYEATLTIFCSMYHPLFKKTSDIHELTSTLHASGNTTVLQSQHHHAENLAEIFTRFVLRLA